MVRANLPSLLVKITTSAPLFLGMIPDDVQTVCPVPTRSTTIRASRRWSWRNRHALGLTLLVLILYFAYILAVAFAPDWLARRLGPGMAMTLGMPLGLGIIAVNDRLDRFLCAACQPGFRSGSGGSPQGEPAGDGARGACRPGVSAGGAGVRSGLGRRTGDRSFRPSADQLDGGRDFRAVHRHHALGVAAGRQPGRDCRWITTPGRGA